jgi:hypothetical protein
VNSSSYVFFDAAFSSELQGPAVLVDELNAIVAGTDLRTGKLASRAMG